MAGVLQIATGSVIDLAAMSEAMTTKGEKL